MKKLVLSMLMLWLGLALPAQQTFDLVSIVGRYGFPQSYDSIYDGKASEYGATLNLAVPVKISEKSMWFTSINYFYWYISDNEQMPSGIANPLSLHGIILRTGLIQKVSKKSEIQLLFAPRLMSDYKNVNGSHFQYGGIAMWKKTFSKKLTIGFGAMYNQECFGPYLVPLIDLNWQISERWSISGLIPVYSKIKYKVNDRLNLGIAHFGLITSYKLGGDDYQGDYIDRSSIDVTFFTRYRVVGDFYIEGRFGYALSRHYEQYAADQKVDFSLPLVGIGDNRIAKNVNFKNGMIIELRLVYSVPIPETE
jgi:hypothetical protein